VSAFADVSQTDLNKAGVRERSLFSCTADEGSCTVFSRRTLSSTKLADPKVSAYSRTVGHGNPAQTDYRRMADSFGHAVQNMTAGRPPD